MDSFISCLSPRLFRSLPPSTRELSRVGWFLVVGALVACGGRLPSQADAGGDAGEVADSGTPVDAAVADAGVDSGVSDGDTNDAGGGPVLDLPIGAVEPYVQALPVVLAPKPGFADEMGGGVFVDEHLRPVRLQSDFTQVALEPHPSNTVFPSTALGAFAFGPHATLLKAPSLAFHTDSAWYVELRWDSRLLQDTLIDTLIEDNGVMWLVYTHGMFRLEGGSVYELRGSGGSLSGIIAVAPGPSPWGGSGVWVARGYTLHFLERKSKSQYVLHDINLPGRNNPYAPVTAVGSVVSPYDPAAGELWVATSEHVWQLAERVWKTYVPAGDDVRMRSRGSNLWASFRGRPHWYDAKTSLWRALPASWTGAALVAVDPVGSAVLVNGPQASVVAESEPIRIRGLDEGERVYAENIAVSFVLAKHEDLVAVQVRVDNGATVQATRSAAHSTQTQGVYEIQGPGGDALPLELGSLPRGWHQLQVTASLPGGATLRRSLWFDYRADTSSAFSYARDVRPIFAARCERCHTTAGPGRDLSNYELMKTNAARVARSVEEKRMPADGPMEPVEIQTLVQWVSGGALP